MLRPINSCMGSPTYELSKYLTRILKCLYDEEYTVKNSKDFVDFVSTKKVLPNEQIVSFDVVSLFNKFDSGSDMQFISICIE